ncbi:MAG TPA: prolyl oligopeptidase family serine peptidase [Vicinamibacterales bacterium]
MSHIRRTPLVLALVCLLSLTSLGAAPDPPGAKVPITMADILAWKSINGPVLSHDGKWLAYRLSPTEGDSEVVVRQTQGEKEYRFGCGDVSAVAGGAGGPAGPGGRSSDSLAFSGDSAWVAFSVAPTKKEAAQLRKQRKPLQDRVALVDLATGKDVQFPRVRRFAFAGGRSGWLALLKYQADAGGSAGATPGSAAGGTGGPGASAGSGSAASDRPKGADLILRELPTGNELNVGNVADFAFDKPGRWIAWTTDAQDQSGNGVTARNLETGVQVLLDGGKAWYERPTWTEKGDGLAALKGTEDKAYKDKLYALVAFTGFEGAKPARVVYDPVGDKGLPAGMTISPDRNPEWSEDLSAVVLGLHAIKKKDDIAEAKPAAHPADDKADAAKAEADPDEKPDLVLWHYQDRRLQTQQQVEEDRDKRFSFVAVYRPATRKLVRLADDTLREVQATPRSRWAVGLDTMPYELGASMDGRRYQDVYIVDLQTGDRRLAVRKVRGSVVPSPDSSRVLYFEDGHYFAYEAATGKTTNLTAALPTSFIDDRDDHNVTKPPVPPIGWSNDSQAVLLSDGWDIWQVPVSMGPATNLTVTGRKEQVRYQRRLVLDRDEKGIDLGQALYVSTFGEWTKKGGVARIEPGKPGAQQLLWDDAQFNRVMKAKSAETFVYSRETYKEPPDLYVADAWLKVGRKVTALDAQMARVSWSAGSMLVEYTPDEKTMRNRKLQGALFLPADYQKGKPYPTLVYIYERLSQDYNRFFVPTANGFNKSVYTSNGYAVLMPDITYKLNDPGRSAVWCVVPAVKAAVATGVVDATKVGLQGHSWGGYQTAFLVTQTNTFAAAIAGAPLTDMVSMYSLIYKNSGNTNQAIFESSQGRFLGGYWDNWDAYYRNSPVFFARNVRTPLVILHNDKDGAVDFTQGVEYFNTLRRIGKPVWMLEYLGENHGLRKPANMQDYTVRMREFFDHYLKGVTAPAWLKQGVSRLDIEDHLRERAKLIGK